MDIPERYQDYECGDYFGFERYLRGIWSESEQLEFIVSAEKVLEHPEIQFLVVGRPGVDGIEFGYRKGQHGIWAFYPISREFSLVAPNLDALLDGWRSGSIRI